MNMTPIELPGLPERPLREYSLTGVLEFADGQAPPVPLTNPAVVEAVHTASMAEWRLRVRAGSASRALEAAELVLPEAAGATWTVTPAWGRRGACARTAETAASR